MTPQGEVVGNNHDVGERISWTLRPVVSSKLNLVIFEDGFKEDFPESRELPRSVPPSIRPRRSWRTSSWSSVRCRGRWPRSSPGKSGASKMKGACLNCHNNSYVDNFYEQFDRLVELYNDKFAIPAKRFMTS